MLEEVFSWPEGKAIMLGKRVGKLLQKVCSLRKVCSWDAMLKIRSALSRLSSLVWLWLLPCIPLKDFYYGSIIVNWGGVFFKRSSGLVIIRALAFVEALLILGSLRVVDSYCPDDISKLSFWFWRDSSFVRSSWIYPIAFWLSVYILIFYYSILISSWRGMPSWTFGTLE